MEGLIKSSFLDMLHLRCLWIMHRHLNAKDEQANRYVSLKFRKEGCAGDDNAGVVSKQVVFCARA